MSVSAVLSQTRPRRSCRSDKSAAVLLGCVSDAWTGSTGGSPAPCVESEQQRLAKGLCYLSRARCIN